MRYEICPYILFLFCTVWFKRNNNIIMKTENNYKNNFRIVSLQKVKLRKHKKLLILYIIIYI